MADGEVIADGDPVAIFYDESVMARAALRAPMAMQLAAALTPHASMLGPRTVEDLRRCLPPQGSDDHPL